MNRIHFYDLCNRVASTYGEMATSDDESEQGRLAFDMRRDLLTAENTEELICVLDQYGFDRQQATEFVLDALVEWPKKRKKIEPSPNASASKLLLDQFSARVKELGGRYFHRYPHAKRTKYYGGRNRNAFETAAQELNLQATIELYHPDNPGTAFDFYIEGHTLRGTRSAK